MAGFVIIKDQKQNSKGAGIEMAVVFIVLLSVFAAYDSVFETEITLGKVCGILLGVTLVLSVLMWNGKHLGWKGLLLVLITGIAAAIERERFLAGIAPMVNRYVEQRNQFYHINQPLMTETAGGMEWLIVLSGILLLLGMVLAIVLRGRRGGILTIPVILLPVVLAATVGYMPSAPAVWGMLAAGSLYLIVYHGERGSIPIRESAAAAIILAMLYLCNLIVQPQIQNYKDMHLKEYAEIKEAIITSQADMLDVRQLLEDRLVRDSNYAQSGIGEGDLKNLSENQSQGTQELEVTVTEYPESSIYLRAYVGTTYTGDKWKELSALTLQSRLSSSERREVLNEPYDRIEKGSRSIEKQQMKLRILEAEAAYGYAPYYAQVSQGSSVKLDACIDGKGTSDREYVYYPRKQAENLSASELGEPSEVWEVYEEFVQDVYKEYPAELEKLADWCASIDDTSVETVSEVIDQRFASNLRYSLVPGQKPEDQDFTEYFLFENYRGFCVHFATAATLIYRECGYPARYVEGYAVSPDTFQKQEDGTYRAVVTDDMAHAWCETFDSETGWRVREHTLPYVEDSKGDVSATEDHGQETEPLVANDADNVEHSADEQNNNDGNATDNMRSVDDEGNAEDGSSGSGQGSKQAGNDKGVMTGIKSSGRVLVTVLSIAGVFVILCVVQQKVRRQKKLSRFRVRRDGRRVAAIYNELCDICIYAGSKKHSRMDKKEIDKKGMEGQECQAGQKTSFSQYMSSDQEIKTERQMLEWMKARFPQMTEAEWEWIYERALRAAFAEEGVSREEEKECYLLYRRFRKEILKGLKGWRKFWFRYGRVL